MSEGVVAVRDEDPVVAVDLRAAERLTHYGEDPDARLAGRLGDELFEPETERRHRRRNREGALVAPGEGARSEEGCEARCGSARVILRGGDGL
ncbi:MAG: hypothetical protein M5T61_06730 [Acidimicrobiia bacterium]|nr:hypothetical protein [Acidimicrobiia bacterium]